MPRFFQVNEQFDSIQGEGILTGLPSTFIRLQGCPVGCSWCDSGPLADEMEGKRRTNGLTANTWGKGGEQKTLQEIMDNIHEKHVIITGGEPTIWNLDPILRACAEAGYTTQLETSGLKDLIGNLVPDWVTWSPKKNLNFHAPIKLKTLVKEVKFVVDEVLTVEDVQELVDGMFYERCDLRAVVLMPEGCPPGPEAIAKAMHFLRSSEIDYHGFQARFGDRLQYRLGVR